MWELIDLLISICAERKEERFPSVYTKTDNACSIIIYIAF